MREIKALVFIAFLIFSEISFSQSKNFSKGQNVSWLAHILRQTESPQLQGLNFFSKSVPVVLVPNENELRPLVEIKYKFEREGWKIQVQGAPGKIANENDKIYTIFAFLNSQVSEIFFTAIGPEGQKETETVYLFAPEAQEFQVVSTWNSLIGYFGLANLSYEQSGSGVLSTKSLLLGLSYVSADSSSKLGTMAAVKLTAATFSSEPIAASPQYLEAHAALSWRLALKEESRWRYKIFFGVNHMALLSNGSPFGFQGLMAPELGWVSQYFKNARVSYVIETRAVLLKNPTLKSQRGLHALLTLSETLKSGRRQDWTLHLSTTDYVSEGQRIAPHIVGLTLGYSF